VRAPSPARGARALKPRAGVRAPIPSATRTLHWAAGACLARAGVCGAGNARASAPRSTVRAHGARRARRHAVCTLKRAWRAQLTGRALRARVAPQEQAGLVDVPQPHALCTAVIDKGPISPDRRSVRVRVRRVRQVQVAQRRVVPWRRREREGRARRKLAARRLALPPLDAARDHVAHHPGSGRARAPPAELERGARAERPRRALRTISLRVARVPH